MDFTGATPLRKNATRRDDKQEIEPEVYARAALKYIRSIVRAYFLFFEPLSSSTIQRAHPAYAQGLRPDCVHPQPPERGSRKHQRAS